MAITIYNRQVSSGFQDNGLGILNECLSVYTNDELNGDYSLELTYPVNSPKAALFEDYNIIKVAGQLFRIYRVQKEDLNRIIHVWARHIFYDLAMDFIEDKRCDNGNMALALQKALECSLGARYTYSSDITDLNTIYHIQVNPVKAIFNAIERWEKGELIRNNFDIKINSRRGADTGVLIKPGKNIRGLTYLRDTSEACTKIFPVGADGLVLTERYIMVPGWDSAYYPGFPIIKRVEYPDATNEIILRNMATVDANTIGLAFTNIQVDFVELSKSNEYANFASLTTVNVGDNVIARHSDLDIDLTLRVLKITRDELTGLNTKVELGQERIDYVSQVSTQIDELMQGLNGAYTQIKQTNSEITLKASQSDLDAMVEDVSAAMLASSAAQTAASDAQTIAIAASTTASNAQSAADAAQADADAANAAASTAQTAANNAQSTANTASTNASDALTALFDLSSDARLTPIEKTIIKKEWDAIVSEKTANDTQATAFGITTEKTTYGTKYTALSTYITPLLASMSATSDIDFPTFALKFKEYYDARTALLNAISTKAKALADAAQTTANTANSNAAAAQSTANTANSAAAQAQADADAAQSTADQAATDLEALTNRVSSAETSITQNATAISLKADLTYVNTGLAGKAAAADVTADAIKLKVGYVGGNNLIKNGSFKTSMSDWTLFNQMALGTTIGRLDSFCVGAIGAYGATSYALQEISINAPGKFIVSCYAKATSVVLGATSPFVRLYAEAIDGAAGVHTYQAAQIIGTVDWTRYFFVIDSSGWSNTTIATIKVYGMANDFTGTILYDDFMVSEGETLTAWTPNANEIASSNITMTDSEVKITTPLFKVAIPMAGGEEETAMQINETDGASFPFLVGEKTYVEEMHFTGGAGSIFLGDDTPLDIWQPSVTISVGDGQQFETIQAAINSLKKRLMMGGVVINIGPGVYSENLFINGFYGLGSLTLNFTGGATRSVVEGDMELAYNNAPIFITGTYSADTDPTKYPVIYNNAVPYTVRVYYNSGYVAFKRMAVKSVFAGSSCLWVAHGGRFKADYCCFECTASYNLIVSEGSVAWFSNIRGNCATNGLTVRTGSNVYDYGTYLQNTSVTMYELATLTSVGTITATAGACGYGASPVTTKVAQYNIYASRSYIGTGGDPWAQPWDEWINDTYIRQGKWVAEDSGDRGPHTGVMSFGSGPTALAGKTIKSGRIKLKRTANDGSAVERAIMVYATNYAYNGIPAAGSSENAVVTGGANNIGTLNLNEQSWLNLPIALINTIISGKCIALYNGNSYFFKIYGAGSSYIPVLEITYLG